MKKENEVLLFFAKPVYQTKLDLNFEKIISLIEKFNFELSGSKNQDLLNVNNIGQASEIKNVLNNKIFYFLKKLIMIEFNKFKNKYLKYKNDFKITTSWLTKTLPNQTSNYHNHKNCIFSGVLYIQTDENSGGINFLNYNTNSSILLDVEEYNFYNSIDYTLTPTNGALIFFPSEIHHKILKNNSNITRYSLAFNLFPTGFLGYGDSSINLIIK
jgi:uncharacterized protein (TIGR02466 family)